MIPTTKGGKETEIKNDSTSVSERQVGMCPSLATGHWGSPVFGGLALLMQQIRRLGEGDWGWGCGEKTREGLSKV